MANNKVGRPSVITDEAVSILVESFHSGMTIRQAFWQAKISHEAYYYRCRNDNDFAGRMARAAKA